MDSENNWFSRIKNKFNSESKTLTEQSKEVRGSGMDLDDEIARLADDFKKPKTFFMLVGDLMLKGKKAMKFTHAELISDLKENTDKKILTSEDELRFKKDKENAWKDFIDAQNYCDSFLKNDSNVREWIFLKSAVESGYTDEIIERISPGMLDNLRNQSGWERVAWTFHVADIIEEKHGKNSCTKELLFETWEQLKKDEEYVKGFFGSCTETAINHWKVKQ